VMINLMITDIQDSRRNDSRQQSLLTLRMAQSAHCSHAWAPEDAYPHLHSATTSGQGTNWSPTPKQWKLHRTSTMEQETWSRMSSLREVVVMRMERAASRLL
jgi:hypothetical protein